MRKVFLIASFLVMFLFSINVAYAYSNKYFDISIPDGYILMSNQAVDDALNSVDVDTSSSDVERFQWGNARNNNSIVVMVSKIGKYGELASISEEDQASYFNQLISGEGPLIKKVYGDNAKISVIQKGVYPFGTYDSLMLKIKITYDGGSATQNSYLILTNNRYYNVIYTTFGKDTSEGNELNNIAASFVAHKPSTFEANMTILEPIIRYTIVGVVTGAIVGGIIAFTQKSHRRKSIKDKIFGFFSRKK